MKVLNNLGVRKSKRNAGPKRSDHAVLAVPSGKARTFMPLFGRGLALAAIVATVITGTTTAARAATIDSTCQSRADSIDTCEWMDTSLIYDPAIGRDDTQIVMYAQMKGGTANREIIQMQLQYRGCAMSVCAIYVAIESQLNVIGGTYTVTFHIGPRLCNAEGYRPLFQWKIYEGKSAGWVSGWSYGDWEDGQISPCYSGGV